MGTHQYNLVVLGCNKQLELKMRVRAAFIEYECGNVHRIILTGGKTAGTSKPSEAEVMAAWLRRKGVPDEILFLETNAKTTAQNARFAKEVIRDDVENTRILTNIWHADRAYDEFARCGLKLKYLFAETSLMKYREYYSLVMRYRLSNRFVWWQMQECIIGLIPRWLIAGLAAATR
jgi:uncharacterized SAM-binding protein YcdF (DUF218 family)